MAIDHVIQNCPRFGQAAMLKRQPVFYIQTQNEKYSKITKISPDIVQNCSEGLIGGIGLQNGLQLTIMKQPKTA